MTVSAKKELVFASTNPGKYAELVSLLEESPWCIRSLSDWASEQVAETGMTFVENAILKARYACQLTGLPAIADDSGLCVEALKGKPGLYSSRFAGENADDQQNRMYLIEQLEKLDPTKSKNHFPYPAYFTCVAVYLNHFEDPAPLIAEAHWHGYVQHHEQGDCGFGYDSLFYLPEYEKTAAQLTATTKNSISHRGRAVRELVYILHDSD